MESGMAVAGAFLVKQLASCSQTARERTLRLMLKTWLPTQPFITDDEMRKLWKALFYCVWHSDKVSYQTHLINRLSSLLTTLEFPLSLVYFRGFLHTLRREWPGIDSLRLDKFYLLVRRFISALFELFCAHGWDSGFVAGFLNAVFCGDGRDGFESNGVDYHIAAVYLEELRRFLPVRREVLEKVVVGPFLGLMSRCSDKVLVQKVKSHVFDVFLRNGREFLDTKKSGVEVDPSRDVAVYGVIGLKMGFATRFFELGSSLECCQGNRKVLLGLQEEFSRLEKALASSGIKVSMMGDCEEEFPELIPIENCPGNVLESESPKKSKRAEKSKKKKKKKNRAVDSSEDGATSSADDSPSDGDLLLDESVLSNLKLQFEKVAAEAVIRKASTLFDSPNVTTVCNGSSLKKRKSGNKLAEKKKKKKKGECNDIGVASPMENVDVPAEMSIGSSVKKVRFAMTNNLVWKPHTPLPSKDLRIPPSVTPRGSALKKGLSPGPITEALTPTKKAKQRARKQKVVRKTAKSVSPAVTQLKKMNSRSV